MIRLYSYWRSSAAYRVRIGLALKGLEYQYLPVNLVEGGGEQFGAVFRAINPQSRVPALALDGQVLTQSLAILEYLDETHPQPAPLLPAAPLARARVRSLALIMAADIQPLQNTSVTRYLKERHAFTDAQLAEWMREWIGRGLGALESRLTAEAETGRFCHGDAATLADLCLVPQCYASRRFGVDPAGYPRVAAIEQACLALPAFQRAAPEVQPDAV